MDYKYYKSDFSVIVDIEAKYMNGSGNMVSLDNTACFNFRFWTTDKKNPYVCSSTGGSGAVMTRCAKLTDSQKVICFFDQQAMEELGGQLMPGKLMLEAEFILPDENFEGDDHENVVRLYTTDITLTSEADKDSDGEMSCLIGADFMKGDPRCLEEVTYEELKALREAGRLIPGQHYRITDYVTTTASPGTQAAGHQFDIIVLADTASTLNENARATLHEDDTYFENAKLEAWQLKYCLDNDTTRWAWAEAVNGKGVIWYMKDEYGNECPYDFKNIMFARYKIQSIKGTATDLVNQYLGFFDIDKSSIMYPSGATLTGGAVYRYTFDYLSGTTSRDTSIHEASQTSIKVHSNVIHHYSLSSTKATKLTNITLGGTAYSDCYGNEFAPNNRNWAIAGNAFANKVGANGSYNSVGQSFRYNFVGQLFQKNSVGQYFWYNSVGNGFSSNNVGQYFQENNVGQDFWYNSVGQSFAYNNVGQYFRYNSVGNGFSSNNVGNSFVSNSVGNWFAYNTVGNSCCGNWIADNIYGITLADGTSGRRIDPVVFEDFDCDYGSWIEGDEDDDGDPRKRSGGRILRDKLCRRSAAPGTHRCEREARRWSGGSCRPRHYHRPRGQIPHR